MEPKNGNRWFPMTLGTESRNCFPWDLIEILGLDGTLSAHIMCSDDYNTLK